MSAPTFFIWRSDYVEGKCVIVSPANIEKPDELGEGISRAEDWPTNVVCAMNPEFPNDIELTDNLYGIDLSVVSKRVSDVLKAHGVVNVEYLPVRIINHKQRIASKDYCILNPLTVIDCIDTEASKVKWNLILKNYIARCERLIIREKDVPLGTKMFRLKYRPTEIIVRGELVEALTRAGCEGLYFTPTEEFQGI